MIDFAALALGPGIATFGRPVTVTPRPSRPPKPPFSASGVWAVRNVDIGVDPGQTLNLNSVTITLGIRLADWAVPPVKEMQIQVPAAGSLPDEGTLWIDDINPDGQGGATLTLKRKPGP